MMIDYANLIERLEDRYMDTKHMLPSPLEHEAAQAIRQLLEYINLIERQRDELLVEREQLVAKAGEVMWERCALKCAELYGWNGVNGGAIRAMPSVTLGDLK